MDFTRTPHRTPCRGLNLRAPVDAMPEGKVPILENVRPYLDNAVQSRNGLIRVNDPVLTENVIHSIFRLNDPTPFAAAPYVRVVGAGVKLFAGTVGAYTELDAGFSGNPLALVPVLPDGQLQPWCYVADSNKQIKVNTDLVKYGIGLPPPTAPPTAVLEAPAINVIDRLDSDATGWTPVGTYAGTIFEDPRVNTHVALIIYDNNIANTGWCNVVLDDMSNIGAGMYISIGTFPTDEVAYIQSIKPALATTTIGSIIYDAGTSGPCTVQLVASVLPGQLDQPVAGAQRRRTSAARPEGHAVPRNPLTDEQRQRLVDFEVDALVTLGAGVETVRITSVSVGPDGLSSFRTSTLNTFAPGDNCNGVPSFRLYLTSTRAGGDDATNVSLQNTITPPSPTVAAMFGGIMKTFDVDLSVINDRPTQPDDEFHLSLKFSSLKDVSEARIYFDVDQVTNDFTQNYYFYAVRPADISASLQEANAGDVISLTSGRQIAVLRSQVNTQAQNRGGVAGTGGSRSRTAGGGTGAGGAVGRGGAVGGGGGARRGTVPTTPGGVGADDPTSGSIGTVGRGAVSGQIGGGVNQWAEIRFKVSELSRVGADQTRTLANVKAVQIMVSCAGSDAVQIFYSSLWLGGAHGPDVGTIGDPYIYCWRPRSTITGAVGNPSPAMRSGVSPRRQGVTITAAAQHPSPECDQVEWFRQGGALPGWRAVAITPNENPPTLNDTYADSVIVANGGLEYDNFQPWPVTDKPRTGTVTTAGTAINWVSGDKFNTSWAPGTPVIIGGQIYTLYAQPTSDVFMEVLENVGTLTDQVYSIQDATILGQPLPCFWGDYNGFWFACGDERNPGLAYWCKGNNPEVASDANNLQVTPPSEPLMNGLMCDRRPFVLSSDNIYELIPSNSGITDFDKVRTAAGDGLYCRWGACTDGINIYFISKTGIKVSQAGNPAESITDDDLYPFFPHEGTDGIEANGYFPPDFTRTAEMQLSWANGYLYFDYFDENGSSRTLTYYPPMRAWLPDVFAGGSATHAEEQGAGVLTTLIGGINGFLNIYDSQLDDTTPIVCRYRSGSDPLGDPRLVKNFGDVMVDADAQGGAGFDVTVGFNLFVNTFGPTTINTGIPVRNQGLVDVDGGRGYLARDVAIDVVWVTSNGLQPVLYTWESAAVPKGDNSKLRATDYEDCGHQGAKFIQGVWIRANTGGVARTVQVEYDGGQVGPVLTVNQAGDILVAYPNPGGAWTPFMANLVRLRPLDLGDEWTLIDHRFVFEFAPPLASVWQTQPLTFGINGFFVHRPWAYVAYISTGACVFTVTVDGVAFAYNLPSTGGAYRKTQVPLQVMKGKSASYTLTGAAGVRLFQKDLEIGVREWGATSPWSVQKPFGEISGEGAAKI